MCEKCAKFWLELYRLYLLSVRGSIFRLGNTKKILSLFCPLKTFLKTLIEGIESPRHSSLIEAINIEKIENEWKFPFQGIEGAKTSVIFHLCFGFPNGKD